MGLLDDAIREHLELKRKHGAAEDELLRQETEALGPARRDFPADEPAPPSPPEEAEPELVPPAATDDDGWFDESPGALPFDQSVPPEPESELAAPAAEPFAPEAPIEERLPPVEPAPFEEQVPPVEPAPFEEPAAPAEPPLAGPPPVGAPPPPPAPAPGETPAAGFPPGRRKDVADEAEGEDGEDVLEETPDFLQDTPEHDRLWFEQKPPRDFDFDD